MGIKKNEGARKKDIGDVCVSIVCECVYWTLGQLFLPVNTLFKGRLNAKVAQKVPN